jgi:hypothetical protein
MIIGKATQSKPFRQDSVQKSGSKMKELNPAADRKPHRIDVPADGYRVSEGAEDLDHGYALICEQRERAFSNKTLLPAESSATTIRKVLEKGSCYLPDLKPSALVAELAAQCEDVSNGNMRRPEALLMTQAQSLDLIFNDLVQRFYDKVGNLELGERLLRLALKAQSQSRATIENLSLVKNPLSATFVRQANMTTGPQQVNNNAVSRAREIKSVQSELLEQSDGERLEPTTSGRASRQDPEMAPVGKIDRAKDR